MQESGQQLPKDFARRAGRRATATVLIYIKPCEKNAQCERSKEVLEPELHANNLGACLLPASIGLSE